MYVSDVYDIRECARIHKHACMLARVKESAVGQFSPHLRNLFVDWLVILVQYCSIFTIFALFLHIRKLTECCMGV